jgi:hypothetical protein
MILSLGRVTLIWGHKRQYGLEIVPWHHPWFIGIDRNAK